MTFVSMKSARIITFAFIALGVVEACPGEVINTCITVDSEEPTGEEPAGWYPKNAYAHLTFNDGPEIGPTDRVLDILKEMNHTKATFFLRTEKLNEDTRYLVDRMVDEVSDAYLSMFMCQYILMCTCLALINNQGHHIGNFFASSSINFFFMNNSMIEKAIIASDEILKEYIGEVPNVVLPPYGAVDNRSRKILRDHGKTIALWDAGCNDWYMTGNDIDLETSTAAIRFTLGEAGGIFCLGDSTMAPDGDGERLQKLLDDTWPYW